MSGVELFEDDFTLCIGNEGGWLLEGSRPFLPNANHAVMFCCFLLVEDSDNILVLLFLSEHPKLFNWCNFAKSFLKVFS
jgi:hypothetical protein